MKPLDSITKRSSEHLVGNEVFTYCGEETDMTVLEYWRWLYSELFDLQSSIAEYIVAKALGLEKASNVGDWTLYDIEYRSKRVEVKETSYLHAWQADEAPKSQARSFRIRKAHDVYQDSASELHRQNDIYVFCLNTGETRKAANPLQLEHWEFYIVPTAVINEKCGDANTISLSRLRSMAPAVPYPEIKAKIDAIIDGTG